MPPLLPRSRAATPRRAATIRGYCRRGDRRRRPRWCRRDARPAPYTPNTPDRPALRALPNRRRCGCRPATPYRRPTTDSSWLPLESEVRQDRVARALDERDGFADRREAQLVLARGVADPSIIAAGHAVR